ncbi:MAG: STAS domain-containing protein [Chloroflexi bacterium]|nr:MAG: STAS domain-containing protein [Chloroflexota bacterium]
MHRDSAVRVPQIGEAIEGPREKEGRVVYSDHHLVVTRTTRPRGLMVAGEIDISNIASVADSLLDGLEDGTDPHLDLSRVTFCDVSGIRALVSLALELAPNRRLLVHGLPPQLETVLEVTGWAHLPGLELCNCGADV